jgi:hypothetical protein
MIIIFTVKSISIICTRQHIILWWWNEGLWYGWGMKHAVGVKNAYEVLVRKHEGKRSGGIKWRHHNNWFYSLLQALIAPTMLFHWLRSCALFLHPWIPRTRKSCSRLSSHLTKGLPACLLPSFLVNVTFLHGSVSLARYRCPNHLSLPAFVTLIISHRHIVDILVVHDCLLRQLQFSLIGPCIFLSNIFNLFFFSVFVNVQLSLP